MRVSVTIDDGTTVGDEFEADVTYRNHSLSVKPDKAGTEHYYGYFVNINKTSTIFLGSTGVGQPMLEIFMVPMCEEKDKPPKSLLSRTLQRLIDATRALSESIVSKLKGWREV